MIGVLFSFDPSERPKLDKAEGLGNGYEHATVTVIDGRGHRQKVLTYVATPDHIDDRLRPYTWYKDLVLAGGAEHGLPAQYVDDAIKSVEADEDSDTARDRKERAILRRAEQ